MVNIMNINVTKRDGSSQKFDIEKIHRVLEWATDGIENVSISEIELSANIQLYDGIAAYSIHDLLIRSSGDLITENTPNYQYVAGRLINYKLRKEIYNSFSPIHLLDLTLSNVESRLYHSELLDLYSKEEYEELNSYIDHDRDFNIPFAGMEQFREKYLVRNRSTSTIVETPQMAFMLIAMTIFQNYSKLYDNKTRIQYIKNYYDAISQFYITLPTPIIAGARTPEPGYASCFVEGSRVLTNSGFKNIEEIEVGENVLTKNGQYNKVLSTRKISNEKSTVKFDTSFSYNGRIECTEEHEIFSIKKWAEGESKHTSFKFPRWNRADHLDKGDYVLIPFNKDVKMYDKFVLSDILDLNSLGYTVCDDGYIRKVNIDPEHGDYSDKILPVENEIAVDGDLFRLFGYYLSEGYSTNNVTAWTLGTNEKSTYIKDIVDILNSKFKFLNPTVNENKSDNSTKITIHSLIFGQFIRSLFKSGFKTKICSDDIMKSDPTLQRELLNGVIRGDGCVNDKCGVVLTMCNENLIFQMGHMCLRNGLYPNMLKREPTGEATGLTKKITTKSTAYTLNLKFSGNYDFIKQIGKPFECKISKIHHKGLYSKYVNGDFYSKITKITKNNSYSGHVYDLQVDNQQSFVVNGVCVHNCVLISAEDSLNSLFGTTSAIGEYISNKAGIGIYAGAFRAKGQPVANGAKTHTGLVPFYRLLESSVQSVSQGSVRKGSGTLFYPVFHLDFEDLIVLKSTKVSKESSVNQLDYGIQLNKLFYERFIQKGNITFFTPDEVPDLWEAFYSDDYDKFVELYTLYENDQTKTRRSLSAEKVFDYITTERKETGRIYIHNIDLTNTYTPFYDPIYQSNLCVEILTPTKPLKLNYRQFDGTGEISHCTLSAINLGKLDHYDDFEKWNDLAVRALDEILDLQGYMYEESEKAQYRRNLGIGWTNLAYFLAKRGLKYDESAFQTVHDYAEAHMYYALKASCLLAKDKLSYKIDTQENFVLYPNKYNIESDYFYDKDVNGRKIVLPIDNYKSTIDELVAPTYKQDWEYLRGLLRKYGCMNSTLVAMMPCENSTLPANSTSGIDRVRSLITKKESQNTTLKQVVPEIQELADQYDLLWDGGNDGPLKINAIIQKFGDQGISTNTSYNPKNYPNDEIPQSTYIKDILIAYKYGLKTMYYHNTLKDASVDDIEENCESCSI